MPKMNLLVSDSARMFLQGKFANAKAGHIGEDEIHRRLGEAALHNVVQRLAKGHKIDAIRQVRAYTNCSLQSGKVWVDRYFVSEEELAFGGDYTERLAYKHLMSDWREANQIQ